MTRPVLSFGADQDVISSNIEQLMASGELRGRNVQKQAQAIAYKQARRSGHREKRRKA
jgi:hypothetical protein